MHARVHSHVHMHTRIHTRMRTQHMHTCIHDTYAHTHAHTTHAHTCMHIRTHSYNIFYLFILLFFLPLLLIVLALGEQLALGSNETLMSLDISGNAIGNKGAFMLAKSLQVNQSLRRIWLDENQITSAGRQCTRQPSRSHTVAIYYPYRSVAHRHSTLP